MSEPSIRGEAVRGGPRAGPAGLASRLETLEQVLAQEPAMVRDAVAPLLSEVREGTRELEPGPLGARPAPKEREAWCERLVKALDRLEDVLEALRLAARAEASGRRD